MVESEGGGGDQYSFVACQYLWTVDKPKLSKWSRAGERQTGIGDRGAVIGSSE